MSDDPRPEDSERVQRAIQEEGKRWDESHQEWEHQAAQGAQAVLVGGFWVFVLVCTVLVLAWLF